MSSVGLLGLLWAVVGIWVGSRWWAERGSGPARAHREVRPRARFGTQSVGGPVRRRQAMRLAYAAGATTVGVGLVVGWAPVLALGAALVNLGTLYRTLVLLLDEWTGEESPEEVALAAARHLRGRRPVLQGSLALPD